MITIDNEFKTVVPNLHPDELRRLTKSILSEGCRDALIVWNGTLIDGHNRYDICTKHNIPFSTKEKQFDDRYQAINWIIENQLGRRNLTPDLKIYLIGKMYNETKKNIGEHKGNQHTKMEMCHFGTFPNPLTLKETAKPTPPTSGSTAAQIAKGQKVGKRTVMRASIYAEALDKIGETLGENIKDDIVNRVIPIPNKHVIKIAAMPKEHMMPIIVEYHPDNKKNGGNGRGTVKTHTLKDNSTKTDTTKEAQGNKEKATTEEVKTLTRTQAERLDKLKASVEHIGNMTTDMVMNAVLPIIERKCSQVQDKEQIKKAIAELADPLQLNKTILNDLLPFIVRKYEVMQTQTIEKLKKEIQRLGNSHEIEETLLNDVLPFMASQYPAIDKVYRVTKYSSYVLELTYRNQEYLRDLREQQKTNFGHTEKIQKLQEALKSRKTDCNTLCEYTNERIHDHFVDNLEQSIGTIKQHLFASRYMQNPADKEINEQLTMNHFFNFLTVAQIITMSHVLTEKAARMLGIFKGLLQLDECVNIRALPRLNQRLSEIEKEFKNKGLSKAVAKGMTEENKFKLVPDKHMEKRLMKLGLISKTDYFHNKAQTYEDKLQMQSLN